MGKLKVYLDTSVISHLLQNDVPEKMEIAQQIIDMGILTKKSYDDCQHIGAAITSECDCIISWNFKHIVNIKTISYGDKCRELKKLDLCRV